MAYTSPGERGSAAPPAARVVLVHWDAGEAPACAARIAAAGYEVEGVTQMTPAALKALTTRPPHALVIDLSRLPSHGRRVGEVAREQRSLRTVPLVFVGGDADRVAQLRRALPGAVFTSWRAIERALAKAISTPLAPAAQAPVPAGYSGTPLPRKLGIRSNATVALVGAPEGFEAVLGELPDGTRLRRDLKVLPDLAVFFAKDVRTYEGALPRVMKVLDGGGGTWIAWPKKASGLASDLDENVIRDVAIANGLVDIKVCAIDSTWSGLRLARRRGSA